MKQYKGIYGYWDTEKDEIAYVGRDAHMDKEKRRKAHMNKALYDDQPFNRILQNNPDRYQYYEICKLPVDASNDELNNCERYYIKILKPKFNFNKGGDGNEGYKHRPESIELIRKNCSRNDLDPKELYESYLKEGSFKKVARLFDCGYGTARKYIKQYMEDNDLPEIRSHKRTDLNDKDLYELYLKLGSYKKVGQFYGCDAMTALRHIKKYQEEHYGFLS